MISADLGKQLETLVAKLVEGSDFDQRLAEVERRLAETATRAAVEGRRCR